MLIETIKGANARADRSADVKFCVYRAAPSRILPRCLQSLHRGDQVSVLTGPSHSSISALLSEVARLLARDYGRVLRLDGAESGERFMSRLRGIYVDRLAEPMRTLLIIERAEMMPAKLLVSLQWLCDRRMGFRPQILLAGSQNLLSKLCEPECNSIWRQVRLTLALEETTISPSIADLAQLEAEIARKEAKLAAQRRILSIFADGATAA